MSKPAWIAGVALIVAGALPAQVVLTTNPWAMSGGSSHKNLVRGAAGQLYNLSVFDDGSGNRPLLLLVSTDGGQTWTSDPFTFNDASSGLNGPATAFPATNCALAIDSGGTLHAVWGRYWYPSYFQQFYRNYNPATAVASSIVDLTALFGLTITSRTDATDITVDASDTVWMAVQTGSSWISQLVRSTLPSAAGLTFTSVGAISPSASSQAPVIIADAQGLIHCAFYRNVGAGNYEHRIFDPVAATWSASIVLGNTTPTNDFFGKLAADALGNVHALYAQDAFAPSTWQFRYKRWDAVSGWSPEVVLFDAVAAQYTGIANYQIFALACNEATGKAYAVYRDLSAGAQLRLAEKGLGDPGFTVLSDIVPSAAGLHEYYAPAMRGTLFPSFNMTLTEVDITWQHRPGGAQPFSLMFLRVNAGQAAATITLSAPAAIGTSTTIDLSSPGTPNAGYLCALAAGTTPGITLSDSRVVPLNYDLLFILTLTPGNGILINNSGVLDGGGQASVIFVVPFLPGAIGLTVYSAFVTGDPAHPTGVGVISPPLAITIQ